MIIRIEKRTNPYVQIDRKCLEDSRLTFAARGLLAYLLCKPDTWEVRIQELVIASPKGREAAQSALSELKAAGYAALVPVFGEKGRLIGKSWLVRETPELSPVRQTGKPSVGQPSTDERLSRPSGKPSDGKAVDIVIMSSSNNHTSNNNTLLTLLPVENENFQIEDQKKELPPVPPPPPQKNTNLTFIESPVFRAGEAAFESALVAAGAAADTDFSYYWRRCIEWRPTSGNAAVSADWLRVASHFITTDKNPRKIAQQQHEQQQQQQTTNTAKRRIVGSVDIDAVMARTQRMLDRRMGKQH